MEQLKLRFKKKIELDEIDEGMLIFYKDGILELQAVKNWFEAFHNTKLSKDEINALAGEL